MNKNSYGGKWLADLNQELQGSERACAVLSGALIDDRLKSLLLKYLLPTYNENNDRLLGRFGALESFSSRIELARRLNLISEEMRKALDWIRNIRNDAAHMADFSLDTQSNRDKITNLITTLNLKEKAPSLLLPPYNGLRGNFVSVVTMLIIFLELEAKETAQTKYQPIDVIGNFEVVENNG